MHTKNIYIMKVNAAEQMETKKDSNETYAALDDRCDFRWVIQ